MIARLEQLCQEYNKLSQCLAAESHQMHEIEDVSKIQGNMEEMTVDALKREVKNLNNQLLAHATEKGDLEKAFQEQKK